MPGTAPQFTSETNPEYVEMSTDYHQKNLSPAYYKLESFLLWYLYILHPDSRTVDARHASADT